MKFGTFFRENIRLSFASILSNRLRSILTMAIIAIGIMSLVGIVTAIESIKASITESFASLGAGGFSIQNQSLYGMGWGRNRNDNFIGYDQAREFRERFSIPSSVALTMNISGGVTAKYRSEKSNPNLWLWGMDENGLRNSSLEIASGRNFSRREAETGARVAVIGYGVADLLFPSGDSPLGKTINIAGGQYEVVGVLAPKGSGMGMGRNDDLRLVIPITTARAAFPNMRVSTVISVIPDDPRLLETAVSEAEGLFRTIRRLSAADESDFTVERSDSLAAMLADNMATVTLVASLVGLITLLGAAVGLMNIMLVSVSERTREIGTRMALGAKPRMIREQFLLESIVISQLGGICGIVLGIVCGNLISVLTGGMFVVPWLWILVGVALCLIVGVGSGYLPARRAASLDPVEALRYE
ncbi:ABC transporter permease [Rikenella microfusus]|uniref:Macrolide export ATP-binding/permease protein MacB n=1 Tax=Rikenella microfusus TaxID=28139 RepID=A0A379MUT6_9BACT|nr:ABC transporter permease [Rikenella microfusus]SUE34650.1 Macrolide export ATP-binding/permease protein MacB [Rikenella microfusus]HJE88359.1 ABC transporter permease [Rikenella microfusus]